MLLWLTVNLPDLCISVYTYTPVPPLAPARLRLMCVMWACASVCVRMMCALCACDAQHVVCVMRMCAYICEAINCYGISCHHILYDRSNAAQKIGNVAMSEHTTPIGYGGCYLLTLIVLHIKINHQLW